MTEVFVTFFYDPIGYGPRTEEEAYLKLCVDFVYGFFLDIRCVRI